jgi:hypothetical protein
VVKYSTYNTALHFTELRSLLYFYFFSSHISIFMSQSLTFIISNVFTYTPSLPLTILAVGQTGGSVGPVLGPKSYTTGVKIVEGDTAINQALGKAASVCLPLCVYSCLCLYLFFFAHSFKYIATLDGNGSICMWLAPITVLLSNLMKEWVPVTLLRGFKYMHPYIRGTGTHSFLRLDTRTVIGANHMQILPFPPSVATYLNEWAKKNKHPLLLGP